MLYLFSSNSSDLYIQDILNVLALPDSALYPFRYNDEWCASELKDRTAIKSFEGAQALIVLVIQPRGGNPHNFDDNDVQFYPLRLAKIRKLELDGSVLRTQFKLGRYVDWNNLSTLTDADRNRIITDALPSDKRPPKKYIVQSDSKLHAYIKFAESIDAAASAWQEAVKRISKIPDFKNTIFFRVSEVEDASKDGILSRMGFSQSPKKLSLTEVLPGLSGYELKSRTTNFLRLSFFHPDNPQNPVREQSILPGVSKDYFSYIPKPIRMNFRYDKSEVPLLVTTLIQDAITELTIGPDKSIKVENISPPLRAPEISLLLKLNHPWQKVAVTFLLLFLAQLMIAVSGKVKDILPLLSASPTIIANAPLVEWGIAISGSLLTALTLYLLYRRLPLISK
jgi:hypothetical protein